MSSVPSRMRGYLAFRFRNRQAETDQRRQCSFLIEKNRSTCEPDTEAYASKAAPLSVDVRLEDMELFGLLFAVPVTLVTSLVYTGLMLALFTRWPVVKRIAIPLSYLVATSVVLEIGILGLLGAKASYAHLRHIYTVIHFLNLLLAPPALANLVVAFAARRGKQRTVQFWAGTACCWVACITVLFGNIMIDEAIVGVGAGKPFYMTGDKEPNQALERTP